MLDKVNKKEDLQQQIQLLEASTAEASDEFELGMERITSSIQSTQDKDCTKSQEIYEEARADFDQMGST